MPILTDNECKKKYSTVNTLQQICAGESGYVQENQAKEKIHARFEYFFLRLLYWTTILEFFLLKGDSGGPLVIQNQTDKLWYVVGGENDHLCRTIIVAF